jgi:hypothetical protein
MASVKKTLMSDHFLWSERQLAWISPCCPLSHGVPRVDDRRVVNGIVHVIRNALQWRDVPRRTDRAPDSLAKEGASLGLDPAWRLLSTRRVAGRLDRE